MARYSEEWVPYVPIAKRRRQAEHTLAKLRKTGAPVAPVTIAGRLIATTFWGRAWCDNMESYRDYESRLPRGRTYVRNGSVVDLQITPGRITALVSGSELYNVVITIKETAQAKWRTICADCTGGIDSLIELLQGRFSKGVMDRLCRQEGGLFPRPSDIRFSCSCPDHASMCKHVAAVLYGVGARLDQKPELLFCLRAVNETDLLTQIDTALPVSNKEPAADKVLQNDDLSSLFGIDMAEVRGKAPGPGRKAAAAAPPTTASPRPPVLTKQVVKTPTRSPAPEQKAAAAQNSAARSLAPKKAATARVSLKPVVPEPKTTAGKQEQPPSVIKANATRRSAHRVG